MRRGNSPRRASRGAGIQNPSKSSAVSAVSAVSQARAEQPRRCWTRAMRLFRERDRAAAGPAQERRRDEALDDRVARLALEAPEPHRLGRRQLQAGHFPELATNAADDILKIHWRSSCG